MQRILSFWQKVKSVGFAQTIDINTWRKRLILSSEQILLFFRKIRLNFKAIIKDLTFNEIKKFTVSSFASFVAWVKTVRFKEAVTYIRKNKAQFFRPRNLIHSLAQIRYLGFTTSMEDYDKRKLGIFNQLNFLGLFVGLIVPIAVLFDHHKLPALAWVLACSPAMVSVLVLILNYYRKYEPALICYFILYPVITSIVYVGGMDLGIGLFFILYGILAVFFIPRISQMLFCIGLSMVSYFMLSVVLKHYQYQLEISNYAFYLFNQTIAIAFIFYGLFLIKEENTNYQFSILSKNRELHRTNLKIAKQREEIADKAALLEQQTEELAELNSLKNKLFSVISHDLKTPLYALRNLFKSAQEYNMPAEEIKSFLPDVVNELNYTTDLMENLLQWARSQMQSNSVRPQEIDLQKLIKEVSQLLQLQAQEKQIYIDCKLKYPLYAFADRDMVNLVLRNLISNAIKFTPEKGMIMIKVEENRSFIEVFVKDNGIGISSENLKKLFNEYYTSKGTANESGTGLGLMLCKEFLTKNGGQMNVKSESGKGSVFSFTLPRVSNSSSIAV